MKLTIELSTGGKTTIADLTSAQAEQLIKNISKSQWQIYGEPLFPVLINTQHIVRATVEQ